jgi:Co/Zn/Cd efflux system component
METDRRVLRIALALNAMMFVIGILAGTLAQSTGLIADALDMLADASAYGIALVAVGRTDRFKSGAAAVSGTVLLLLGLAVLLDVARRAFLGSAPEGLAMIGIAAISLAVNASVLGTLGRFRSGEVHLRATWIFTRADVVANLGVIASGALVLLTGSRYPDLVAGAAIGIYVVLEAREILEEARTAIRGKDRNV